MPKNRKPRPHASAPSPHTSQRAHKPTRPLADSWDALDAELDALGISYECTTYLVDKKTGKVSVESVHTKVQL